MSATIEMIRKGSFDFPKILVFETFANDIINIYTEMDPKRKSLHYDHLGSDEFFHTLNLIVQAYKSYNY